MELTVRTKRQRFDDAVNLLAEFVQEYVEERKDEGWKFIFLPKTTNSWGKFREQALSTNKTMEVSTEGCEGTIYPSPELNMAARIWHDFVHLELNKDFSFESEALVAKEQARQLANWAGLRGYRTSVIEDACELIQRDIIDQAAYYSIMNMFVVDQKKFIYQCFLSDYPLGEPFKDIGN